MADNKKALANLTARLLQMQMAFKTTDEAFKRMVTTVGLLARNSIIMQIRKKKIIDTGALINSIRFTVNNEDETKANVAVGSYGVVYAAINEFGGSFGDAQRKAMWAALRRRYGSNIPQRNKNVIQGKTFRARPFLRPGIEQARPAVMRTIRQYLKDTL